MRHRCHPCEPNQTLCRRAMIATRYSVCLATPQMWRSRRPSTPRRRSHTLHWRRHGLQLTTPSLRCAFQARAHHPDRCFQMNEADRSSSSVLFTKYKEVLRPQGEPAWA